MQDSRQFDLPEALLADVVTVCRRYHVREPSVFGSAARGELRPDSDIDLLVEFDPDARIGFIAFAGLQRELADLLGRPVDLVPKKGLKPVIRPGVLSEARPIYAV